VDLSATVGGDSGLDRRLAGDASPTLTDRQIDRLRSFGALRAAREGEVLFEAGDADYDFYVVIGGEVAVVDQLNDEPHTLAIHRKGEFVGDLAMLSGGIAFATAVVTQGGELLQVAVPRLRDIVEEEPALSELIVHALLLRRSRLISDGGGVEIIGSPASPDTQRLRRFLRRNGIPHAVTDPSRDERAIGRLARADAAPEDTPLVLRARGRPLVRPTDAELAQALGIGGARPRADPYDLVIIGSGPAGLAASVYAASDGLAAGTVETLAPGGQAGTSPRIENYLGFPAGVSGAELTQRALIQAVKFGAEFLLPRAAQTLGPGSDRTHVIGLDDDSELTARHVILATGARYRRLEVPGATRFEAFGLFYAATYLDAAGCREQEVIVVGGGNSAGQAALSLTGYASRVHLVVRRAELSATMSHYLIERIAANPRVALATSSRIVELLGEDRLEAAVVEGPEGQSRTLRVRAVYALLGADPRTEWLPDAIERDQHGFVLTGEALYGPGGGSAEWAAARRAPASLETSLPNVLAAGDVRAGSVKRVASAVGEGAAASRIVRERLISTW
jgi:thioredoxin reductase (NADPH)